MKIRLKEAVLNLMYPTGISCLVCGDPVRGTMLCSACQHQLEAARLNEPDMLVEEGLPARSVWAHVTTARSLVINLKFNARRQGVMVLAPAMAEVIRPLVTPDTVVTWVPMPRSRYLDRTYDHAEELARAVAAELQLSALPLLARNEGRKAIRHQVGLSSQERQTNLQGTFRCLPEAAGKHVLLVDDVMTTGATARISAACLRQGGAASVCALTATRASHPRDDADDLPRDAKNNQSLMGEDDHV